MKQLLIGLFVWAFFCPSLWAQAKLRDYERAYLGFEAKAALVSPLQLSPRPAYIPRNRSVQARPNFAWLFSLRGLYNIHDRLALSADFGLGRRYIQVFMAHPVYRGRFMSLGHGFQETNINITYRFKTGGREIWYVGAGLGLSIVPELHVSDLGAVFVEDGPPPISRSLSVTSEFAGPASPLSNIILGLELPLKQNRHLLLIELVGTQAWLPFVYGQYQISEFNFRGTVRARASNLSLKIAYLFS